MIDPSGKPSARTATTAAAFASTSTAGPIRTRYPSTVAISPSPSVHTTVGAEILSPIRPMNRTAPATLTSVTCCPGRNCSVSMVTEPNPGARSLSVSSTLPSPLTSTQVEPVCTDAIATYSMTSTSTWPGHCTTTRLSLIQGSLSSSACTASTFTERVGTPATTSIASSRAKAVEFSTPRTTTSRTANTGLCSSQATSAPSPTRAANNNRRRRRRRALSSETPRRRSSIRAFIGGTVTPAPRIRCR
ncbi:hypothetical protein BMS3Bbin02_00633 [bacterium BMS3Bbin02]|nr:hypothetical protein BMS3Bbin02_00633 [bacterium BMS3Bbin02]